MEKETYEAPKAVVIEIDTDDTYLATSCANIIQDDPHGTRSMSNVNTSRFHLFSVND